MNVINTFASFAGEGVIMVARGSVATDKAKFFLLSRYGSFLFLWITSTTPTSTSSTDVTVRRVSSATTTDAIHAPRRRQIFTTWKYKNHQSYSSATLRENKNKKWDFRRGSCQPLFFFSVIRQEANKLYLATPIVLCLRPCPPSSLSPLFFLSIDFRSRRKQESSATVG